jgi:hypothetical protein
VATPIPADDSPYWRFYDEVAAAQLAQWLPARPSRVLDISGGGHFAGQLTAAGHEVLSVDHPLDAPSGGPAAPSRDRAGWCRWRDSRSLDRHEAGCVDLVLAESSALSLCLATDRWSSS